MTLTLHDNNNKSNHYNNHCYYHPSVGLVWVLRERVPPPSIAALLFLIIKVFTQTIFPTNIKKKNKINTVKCEGIYILCTREMVAPTITRR